MKSIETIIIKAGDKFSDLNEASFMSYLKSEKQKAFLNNVVIGPFESSLKGETGYSDIKIPEKKKENKLAYGKYSFIVTSKPTTKRPNYKETYDSLIDYLDEVKADARKKEIENINLVTGVGYCIPLDEVVKKIGKWLETTPGIEQKIDFQKFNPEKKLVVPLIKYGKLTEKSAEIYLKTDAFVSYLEEKIISPFQIALKGKTGYDNENVPKESEETWVPLGNNIARILSSPKPNPKYGDVINTILEDFDKIKKGEEITGYRTQIIKNNYYISMKSTVEKMKKLLEDSTKNSVKHSIEYAPDVSIE